MPWFRLDDSFHSHPKVIKAGNEAVGLYVRCGTYAAEHLTDGFVGKDIVALYGDENLAAALVATRLWHRARGGWTIHDYLDYNPSAQAVENDRKQKAERQARWRERRGPRHNRDMLSARSTKSGSPVDNPVEPGNARPGTRGRRVTNASSNASGDGAPSPSRPEGSGTANAVPNARETRGAANGRASPPGSPARGGKPKPPWCGECDETTRQTGDPPARCPVCHPLASA